MNVKNILIIGTLITVEFFDGMILEFFTQEGVLKRVVLKKDVLVAEIEGADEVDKIGSTMARIKMYNCAGQADFYRYLQAARNRCKDVSCLRELADNVRPYVFDIVGCQTLNFIYELRSEKLQQV